MMNTGCGIRWAVGLITPGALDTQVFRFSHCELYMKLGCIQSTIGSQKSVKKPAITMMASNTRRRSLRHSRTIRMASPTATVIMTAS